MPVALVIAALTNLAPDQDYYVIVNGNSVYLDFQTLHAILMSLPLNQFITAHRSNNGDLIIQMSI